MPPPKPIRRWTTFVLGGLEGRREKVGRFIEIRHKDSHSPCAQDLEAGVPGPHNAKCLGDEQCSHKGYHQHETYNAWVKASELLSKRDTENVAAWTAEVDSLLTFSGLLLTVVTLFIGNASTSLQPDNAGMTVAALQLISQQLQNSTAPGAILASFTPSAEFEPGLDDVVIASLLASSLLLSLISSGMGLWVKEWLREYSLDLPYTARELVHVREYRHHGLERWHMRHLVASISLLLQIAVALFGIGTTMMTWKLNRVLSWVLTAGLALWTIAVWTAAVIPTVSSQCPFKSPLARLV
ncbi:hypothetical protein C8Q76DRAFT_618811, partial [Earliella scabrosa]